MTADDSPRGHTPPPASFRCSGHRFAALFEAVVRGGFDAGARLLDDLEERQRSLAERAVVNSSESQLFGRYVVARYRVKHEWLREPQRYRHLILGHETLGDGSVPELRLTFSLLAQTMKRLAVDAPEHLAHVPQSLVDQWVAHLPRDQVLTMLQSGWSCEPAKRRLIVAATRRSDHQDLPLEADLED